VRPIAVLVALVVATIAGGCVGGQGAASFDPSGPCMVDGQRPGAYPELEGLIPPTFEGVAATRLDSGRNCTERNLGTLATHGIREVRFAGGLWETGARSGVTLAVLTAPGLTGAWLQEFYEAGARAGRRTEDVRSSVDKLDGEFVWQIDTLNGESFQTILVWAGDDSGLVRVVLVASDVRENEDRGPHGELLMQARELFLGH
jgi:hypothetical protein